MGSLRSDGEAFIRTRVKVSLKKLHEQGMLIRATSIPEFSTYTTIAQASLYRAAKGWSSTRTCARCCDARQGGQRSPGAGSST